MIDPAVRPILEDMLAYEVAASMSLRTAPRELLWSMTVAAVDIESREPPSAPLA